jgi:hypothetical protein
MAFTQFKDDLKEDPRDVAVNFVRHRRTGLDAFCVYLFDIHLLSSDHPAIVYECVAESQEEAWILAGRKVGCYNYPCQSIVFKGKKE